MRRLEVVRKDRKGKSKSSEHLSGDERAKTFA